MEETETEEIEMTVVEAENLPEKFRPPSSSAQHTVELPGPLADLIQEATSGLTAAERGAFLQRLRKKKPEIFSEGPSGAGEPGGSQGSSKEKWRERLTRWLKEEANRFMAAAASL